MVGWFYKVLGRDNFEIFLDFNDLKNYSKFLPRTLNGRTCGLVWSFPTVFLDRSHLLDSAGHPRGTILSSCWRTLLLPSLSSKLLFGLIFYCTWCPLAVVPAPLHVLCAGSHFPWSGAAQLCTGAPDCTVASFLCTASPCSPARSELQPSWQFVFSLSWVRFQFKRIIYVPFCSCWCYKTIFINLRPKLLCRKASHWIIK